jgi:hypothetical protein
MNLSNLKSHVQCAIEQSGDENITRTAHGTSSVPKYDIEFVHSIVFQTTPQLINKFEPASSIVCHSSCN